MIAKINKLRTEEDGVQSSTPRTPLTARALNTVDGLDDQTTTKTTKKERKIAKKAVKAMEREKFVTSADILFVANTLHPEDEQAEEEEEGADDAELAEHMEIKLNLKFNNSTCNTKTARHDFLSKERAMDLEKSKADVERVLVAFEMTGKTTGKQAKLIAELTAAIQSDLEHHHAEIRETSKLRKGFWRWANVRAYRELVENGKDWDDHSPMKDHDDAIEELPSANEMTTADTSEDEKSERNGSVDSSVGAASASTAVTVPPSQPTPTKKPKTLTIAVPSKVKDVIGDPGWKQVGKKVLKTPVTAKLKMVRNGGLHHLAQSPKGSYGALTEAWTGPVDEDGKRLH